MNNINIKNYTNHELCFFHPEHVQKGRGADHYTLVNDNTMPYLRIPKGVALSAKNADGNTLTTYANGLTLTAPSALTSQLDIPMNTGVTDNTIFVVSRTYAAEAISKGFDFIQRLYVPSGKVYNSKKKCIGCMTLEKAAMFPFPSFCLAAKMDIYSRRLAATYWKAWVWSLSDDEKAALTRLEQSTIEELYGTRTFTI